MFKGRSRMNKQPTTKQIEAYKLVYIQDFTQEEASVLLGCSRPNVTRLLIRLKKLRPELFPVKNRKQKVFSLCEKRDSKPVRVF